ncbi:MAG: copper transporter [Mycobacterium sp.]
MITLRSHIISLAAVFLALAVGVVLGSGVLNDTMRSGVSAGKAALEKQAGSLTDEKNSLTDRVKAADQFDSEMAGRIVRDSLAGKSVVLFRTPDAEDADVATVIRLVGQAGGSVTGTLSLTNQFVDAGSAEKLRSVVNSPIVPAGTQLNTALLDQSSQAGDLVGLAVLINRDPKIAPVNDEARDTVLSALRDTGFLTYDRVAPADTALVVTGGALADDAGNRGLTVARFAAGLAPHGSGTVLAGRDGSAGGASAVAVTRADAALADAVSTVDDVDIEAGRITTVLALQSLIGGAGPGKYGIGQGAVAVTVPQ